MTDEMVVPQNLTPDIIESFRTVIGDFQKRAEQLGAAYASMQEEFRKINIELDRKNSELQKSLARQEEMQTYLDSILQSMESGVIGVDINGNITHFNRAATAATGYGAVEALGRPYEELFAGEVGAEPELIRVLRQGTVAARMNERVIWHKDKHPIPVSYHQSLLRDSSGNLLGAVEVFSDVSRIKALEREMQQTRTMAALGEMSATVAHEIRNPLGAMGMWAALLERDLGDEDPRRNTLGKIVEGLGRLNKIVSNLLVFTRPVKTEFRKVDFAEVVGEIADFIRIEIERLNQSIVVTYEDRPQNAYVLADPEKMGQTILNLCLNAVQAMPGGGELCLSLDSGTNGYVVLTVADTGSGIAPEQIGKIFDPFFTTKENGTGLGLAIVKKYTESHSGYIDVESAIAKGTRVKLFIPQLKE